ncbi:MAG: hypothetical protein JNL57_07595 [Bacteroidetes bacterium]|nr:hypothetical protein [Bacteroidota bacterium]
MQTCYFSIPKSRAEYPVLAVAAVFVFAVWALHFGIFGWKGGAVWLAIAIPLAFFIYKKRSGAYFVKADENGISWRQSLVSRLIFIPWNYLQRIDYLVYEINFMIKESGQVVSFATSGLEEEQINQLKEYMSYVLKNRKESGIA